MKILFNSKDRIIQLAGEGKKLENIRKPRETNITYFLLFVNPNSDSLDLIISSEIAKETRKVERDHDKQGEDGARERGRVEPGLYREKEENGGRGMAV